MPTKYQVLILLNSATAETVVANAALAVEFCNKSLVDAHSKLRVESMYKVWDGVFMSTNSVAFIAELEVIKQWLKKTAGLGEITEVEPRLPQSKSFLKIFFFFFFFLFINLLHSARSQSMADYLQQVAYSFRGLRGQKPPS